MTCPRLPPKCRHCHPFVMVETYASRLITDGTTLVDMVASTLEVESWYWYI